MILQLIVNGLINGSVIAIVALGFSLVYNTTRIFHFAYSVLYIVAPYIVLTLHVFYGINLGISIFVSLLVTILLSLLIETIVYQPLHKKNASHNQILISSIGIMIIFTNLLAIIYSYKTYMINPGVSSSISISNIIITDSQLVQLITSVAVIFLYMFFIKFSKLGLLARALRDDEFLSKVFAVNIRKLRLMLFALSAILAGTGGILVAYDVGLDPYVGMPMLLNAFVALIIGGLGRFNAPIIGGFVIGLLQSVVIYFFSANWSIAFTFLLLIIFLLFRPQGIIGEIQREV